MEGLSDAEIEHRLGIAPPSAWDALWAAFAAFDAEAEHGTWQGGSYTDPATGATVTQMPYVDYGDAVMRLLAAVGGLGASEPFDWMRWEGTARYAGGAIGLDAAPVADAIRLVTAIQRSERFTEGSLLGAADDGTLRAAVLRLRQWYDARQV